MTDDPRPSHRYYRAMQSAWRGRLSLTITDPAPLAKLGLVDRTLWRMTTLAAAPWLETRVDYDTGAARNEVVHHSLLRSTGVPAAWGRETITLDPDGRRFVLSGRHRFLWMPWTTHVVEGPGEVNEDATGANYRFTYLGAEITQVTRREGEDVLVVTQTMPFGRSEVRLERQR